MEWWLVALTVIIYLAFCASGFLAVINYWTTPGDFVGMDVSWCECIVLGIAMLIPLINVSGNFFWLVALRRKYPSKCPIAFKAKSK